jgi:lysylphosphatidylglycerol synthase-like protein
VPAVARFVARRIGHSTVEKALTALAAGVDEALALLRSRDPAVIAGAAGYMLFDVAMLGVCFAAFGLPVPPAGVLLMAYLIGQLGGLIPLPGGLGGVDGGLIGTLVLYGAGATAAATAVLAYRALVLLLPLALGVPALHRLRVRRQGDTAPVAACAGAPRRVHGLAFETD